MGKLRKTIVTFAPIIIASLGTAGLMGSKIPNKPMISKDYRNVSVDLQMLKRTNYRLNKALEKQVLSHADKKAEFSLNEFYNKGLDSQKSLEKVISSRKKKDLQY